MAASSLRFLNIDGTIMRFVGCQSVFCRVLWVDVEELEILSCGVVRSRKFFAAPRHPHISTRHVYLLHRWNANSSDQFSLTTR